MCSQRKNILLNVLNPAKTQSYSPKPDPFPYHGFGACVTVFWSNCLHILGLFLFLKFFFVFKVRDVEDMPGEVGTLFCFPKSDVSGENVWTKSPPLSPTKVGEVGRHFPAQHALTYWRTNSAKNTKRIVRSLHQSCESWGSLFQVPFLSHRKISYMFINSGLLKHI